MCQILAKLDKTLGSSAFDFKEGEKIPQGRPT